MLTQHHPFPIVEESLATKGPSINRETSTALDRVQIEFGEGTNKLPVASCKGEDVHVRVLHIMYTNFEQGIQREGRERERGGRLVYSEER